MEVDGLQGPQACEAGVIEVTLGSASIRIPPGSDPRLASAVLMALRVMR